MRLVIGGPQSEGGDDDDNNNKGNSLVCLSSLSLLWLGFARTKLRRFAPGSGRES